MERAGDMCVCVREREREREEVERDAVNGNKQAKKLKTHGVAVFSRGDFFFFVCAAEKL